MGKYNLTPPMAGVVDPGTGQVIPFRCYNCDKELIQHLSGANYEVKLECPRCNALITIIRPASIPLAAKTLPSDGKRSPAATPVSSGRSS
jgi:phage FluMu protein Com